MSHTTIVAYVPVVHRGYLDFFRKFPSSFVYLIDPSDAAQFDRTSYISRDTRACSVDEIMRMLKVNLEASRVLVLREKDPEWLREQADTIIMPDEDVSRLFAQKHFNAQRVEFHPVFLRWNWGNVKKEAAPSVDREVNSSELLIQMMSDAKRLAVRSSDWWRQVGAILFRDKEVLIGAYNKHVPSEHTPYLVGDPRTLFGPGESIETSSAHHAEKQVIARAARMGICTEGASIAVTTFPCPGCAMDIAEAGIRTVYYSEGYSLVDAEGILRSRGVSVIKVSNPE